MTNAPIIIALVSQADGFEKHIPAKLSRLNGLSGFTIFGMNVHTKILVVNSPNPLKKGIKGFFIPCKTERKEINKPWRIKKGDIILIYVDV